MIDHLTTVLVTVSPSPRHPETELIEGTVTAIRYHFPGAEIIIACDGVRPEQEHYRAVYSEFVLRMEALCLEKWRNVRLWVSPEFLHQAWTVAKALEQVKTPLLLFTEWDQLLLPEPIPWHDIALMLVEGKIKLCRFMLEDEIKPEWAHLMLGRFQLNGVDTLLTKTVQWSQRTHLASVEYYRWLIGQHLKIGDRCYLEDRLYGLEDEWEDHRLAIFTPPNPRRIWHSDGRGEDMKFESVLL